MRERERDTRRKIGEKKNGSTCKTLKSYHTLVLRLWKHFFPFDCGSHTGLKYLVTSLQRQDEGVRILAAAWLV